MDLATGSPYRLQGSSGRLPRQGWLGTAQRIPLSRRCSLQCLPARSAPFTSQLPHTHQALLTFELVLNTWNNFVSTSTVSSCEPLHGNFSDTPGKSGIFVPLPPSCFCSTAGAQAQHRRVAPTSTEHPHTLQAACGEGQS